MLDPFTANFLAGLAICAATGAVLYTLKFLVERLGRRRDLDEN